ncbi:dihydrolipoyl dehydrogenase [Raoultibacter phocaeensis]|uniref:dihydrolipoyl dehydrogenase n=1 Tax=Raoultibacter phocaeensis TaxID=2479841 RepID=UPI001118EDAE|nr:dihydrolipoyl dehydrogenase [Raoultibacter phocaeensis]
MAHHELVIIGAGPGGNAVAREAARHNVDTVLIEKSALGGTCLNRGCIPTKTILHTANLFHDAANAHDMGLRIENASIDFDILRSRKEEVVERQNQGLETSFDKLGITVLYGTASTSGPDRIVVELEDGTTEELSADTLVIATGTTPAMPPIDGIDLPGVYDSDEMLDTVPELDSLVIVGGGFIGMEYAGIYLSFGTKVTVIEADDRVLATMDKELSQSLAMVMKKRGCDLATGSRVKAIGQTDNGRLSVCYEDGCGEAHTVEAAAVLVATGREASFDDLFIDGFELDLDHGHIAVDDHMRTSVENVYAVGDATNVQPQLAHSASAQGTIAAKAISGEPCAIDLAVVPSCVYTTPEIATVGITTADAKDAGSSSIGKYTLASNAKTVIADLDRSFMKVIADQDGKVVGAHLMCGRATDIIGEAASAIANGLTIEQMEAVIRPHPTFEEALTDAFAATRAKREACA